MAAPTLADFKTHLTQDADTSGLDAHDAELQNVLDAAVELVGLMVGPLTPAAVTETHYGLCTSLLVLRRPPVVSVTSLVTLFDPATEIPSDNYRLDLSQGILRAAVGRFVGDYTVTYTAGWDTLPAPIQLGTLIIAAHLWETQRVPGARRPVFGQQAAEQALRPPVGFAIPNRAATLLEPYRQPVIA